MGEDFLSGPGGLILLVWGSRQIILDGRGFEVHFFSQDRPEEGQTKGEKMKHNLFNY